MKIVQTNFNPELQIDYKIQRIVQQSWILQRICGLPSVDKTMIIKWVIDNPNKKIIVTRPPSWGKTFNLGIIRSFFEFPGSSVINEDLLRIRRQSFLGDSLHQRIPQHESCFQLENPNYEFFKRSNNTSPDIVIKRQMLPTKFSQHWHQYQHHFGNYIVITLSPHFESQRFDQFKFSLLQQLYHRYSYIWRFYWNSTYQEGFSQIPLYLSQKNVELINEKFDYYLVSLLKMINQFHKKKIIVLVKQYDRPYRYIFNNRNFWGLLPNQLLQKEIATMISQILDCIQQQDEVYKIICMGVRNIVTANGFLSNIEEIDSIDNNSEETAELFGFSEEEIREQLILKIFKHQTEKQNQFCHRLMQQIQRMYGGYQLVALNGELKTMYSPNCVLSCINECVQRNKFVSKEKSHISSLQTSVSPHDMYFLKSPSNMLRAMLFKLIIEFGLNQQPSMRLGEQIRHLAVEEMIGKQIQSYNQQERIYQMIRCGYLTVRKGFLAITTRQNWIGLKCMLAKVFQQNISEIQIRILEQVHIYGGLEDWSVYRHGIEKVMSVFFRQQHNVFAQYLLEIFVLVISQEGMLPIVRNQTFHFATQSDGYYKFEEDCLIIQSHRMVFNDFLQQHAVEEIVREKFEQSFFDMLSHIWIDILFDSDQYKYAGRQPIVVFRAVVGVYGYQRSFKTFWKQKKIEFKAQQLAYALDLIFRKRKHVKKIEQIGLYCCNQKIMTAQQFIDCVIDHFERDIYDQNQQILEEVERLWDSQISVKHSREVRNIRNAFSGFGDIKRYLQHRFFGFTKLRNAKLTAADFQEMPMEMIEPQSVLVDEVQCFLDTAQEIIAQDLSKMIQLQ